MATAFQSTNGMNGDRYKPDRPAQGRDLPFFRTCTQECDMPVECSLTGSLPSWLKGTLLRNGPGMRRVGETQYNHLFDGLALIHQFIIDGQLGTVSYRNRFLRSDTYQRNMKANRIVVSEFGTRAFPDPCKSILQRFMSLFSFKDFSDNDNVNLVPVGDEIYATTETQFIRRIDAQTLESLGKVDITEYVAVNTQTAHPHRARDGTVYNLGSNFGMKGSYNVIEIPPSNDVDAFKYAKVICSIPVRRPLYPSYYHSFCITENYIVFIEQPLVVSVPLITLKHFSGGSYSSALKWKPKYKTRFHLINRRSGEALPQKYVSDPFSFFHSINAYEDDGHVVIDLCCYRDGNIIKSLYASSLAEDFVKKTSAGDAIRSEARRYVLPLLKSQQTFPENENLNTLQYTGASAIKKRNSSSILCVHEQLTKLGFNTAELPRINYAFCNGRDYQYFYAISRRDTDLLTQLIKVNVRSKEVKFWSHEYHFPSEPVFIPRPGAIEEDDGVVLAAILSEKEESKGFLLFLDGKTFEEVARADFSTPSAIPSDFHGIFLSG